MLAAAAIPELFKIVKGIQYGTDSAGYAATKRPPYEIPQAMKDYLAQAKFRAATSGLPGEGRIKARMGAQTASSQRAIQQSGQSAASQLQALAALDQSSKNQIAELGVQSARQKERDLGQLYSAEQAMAGEQRRQWEWDKRGPYENAMATAARLQKASTGAIFTGLEGLSGIAQSGFKMGQGAETGTGTDAMTGTSEAGSLPEANYFDANNVYGTGASKPISEYGNDYLTGGFELPNELTNAFQSQYYGMPINDKTSDYYDMNTGFNDIFNSIFRRRGSERTRTYTR